MQLYREEYSLTGIARQTGITVEDVRCILGLDSMTNLTIQETIRQTSESPQFKAAECQELFYCSLYKEETTHSAIDEHTIAMAALRTDTRNIAIIGTAGTEDVAAAYAATYPIALIAVVLASQFLIILF